MEKEISKIPCFYIEELEHYIIYLQNYCKEIYYHEDFERTKYINYLFNYIIRENKCSRKEAKIMYENCNSAIENDKKLIKYVSLLLSFDIYKKCLNNKKINHINVLQSIFDDNKNKIFNLLHDFSVTNNNDLILYTNNLYLICEIINKIEDENSWINFKYNFDTYYIQNDNILGDFIKLHDYCFNLIKDIFESCIYGIDKYFYELKEIDEFQQYYFFNLIKLN